MTAEKSVKDPRLGNNEYRSYEDRRRRKKQHLLNAPYVESDFFGSPRVHGENRGGYIQFRVTPFARKVIEEVAFLFNMSTSQYAKAVLYRDLGLVFEPVDRRRKSPLKKKRVLVYEKEPDEANDE
jgi:hypothetical protein